MSKQTLESAFDLIIAFNRSQDKGVAGECASLTEETKSLLEARDIYNESLFSHGFTNGNSPAQNESNESILAGESLFEKVELSFYQDGE